MITEHDLYTLEMMIHYYNPESMEDTVDILSLYHHVREEAEKSLSENMTAEPKPEKKAATKKPVKKTEPKKEDVLKPGPPSKAEKELKQEIHEKLTSGQYKPYEITQKCGVDEFVIMDMKAAKPVNITIWKKVAAALEEIDKEREAEG